MEKKQAKKKSYSIANMCHVLWKRKDSSESRAKTQRVEPRAKEKNRLWTHSVWTECVPPKFINPIVVVLGVGPVGGNWVCSRSWRWSSMLRLLPL